MSQTFVSDLYNYADVVNTDMSNIEDALNTLKSMFSGATQPSNTVSGMPWYDTTNNLLKVRNAANSEWYGVMHGDTSQKIWIYRNTAMNGWAVDSSVTDKVLALKGGSNDYNISGATTGGDWDGFTHTHTVDGHTHTFTSNSHDHDIGGSGDADQYSGKATGIGVDTSVVTGTTDTSGTLTSNAPNETYTTWRPAAAVGTLQYPNI